LEGLPSDAINLTGRVTLRALGPILSGAALYVGTDTAATHMAAALGVSTIALFGPSNPVKWGPWPNDCLQQLPVSRVIEVADELLQRQHRHPAIVDA
jgi:ADP-heptose:LPS heptosyltransferase